MTYTHHNSTYPIQSNVVWRAQVFLYARISNDNIIHTDWNALGPAFLQSSDPVVEELLFLVFEPAICSADNVLVVRNFVSFNEFFQFTKQIEVTWSQDNAPAHTSAQALAAIQNAGFVYSVTQGIRHLCSHCTANGWLEDQENNSSITESELWRNAGPSALQLHENMLKSGKIWCAYLVVHCVSLSLRTFWTPLVLVAAGKGGQRETSAPGGTVQWAAFGRAKIWDSEILHPQLSVLFTFHTNAIVVTIRISIGDCGVGAATETFAPGGSTLAPPLPRIFSTIFVGTNYASAMWQSVLVWPEQRLTSELHPGVVLFAAWCIMCQFRL